MTAPAAANPSLATTTATTALPIGGLVQLFASVVLLSSAGR